MNRMGIFASWSEHYWGQHGKEEVLGQRNCFGRKELFWGKEEVGTANKR